MLIEVSTIVEMIKQVKLTSQALSLKEVYLVVKYAYFLKVTLGDHRFTSTVVARTIFKKIFLAPNDFAGNFN